MAMAGLEQYSNDQLIAELVQRQVFVPNTECSQLRVDEGGVVRIGRSRVSLDVVVEEYDDGMTPEDIVRSYDTLVLADVHNVIAHYLLHRDEVGTYVQRRHAEAELLRVEIESDRPRVSRDELLARHIAKETVNAPARQ